MALALLTGMMPLGGCTDSGSGTTPETLVVSVDNEGSSGMPTDLTIEGPDGTLLQESFTAGPGNTTREVTLDSAGKYRIDARYEASSSSGAGSQRVDSEWTHFVEQSDCDTEEIWIHFVIEYHSSQSRNSWSNKGSYGACQGN